MAKFNLLEYSKKTPQQQIAEQFGVKTEQINPAVNQTTKPKPTSGGSGSSYSGGGSGGGGGGSSSRPPQVFESTMLQQSFTSKEALLKAENEYRMSGGSYDITTGTFTDRFGDKYSMAPDKVPDDAAIVRSGSGDISPKPRPDEQIITPIYDDVLDTKRYQDYIDREKQVFDTETERRTKLKEQEVRGVQEVERKRTTVKEKVIAVAGTGMDIINERLRKKRMEEYEKRQRGFVDRANVELDRDFKERQEKFVSDIESKKGDFVSRQKVGEKVEVISYGGGKDLSLEDSFYHYFADQGKTIYQLEHSPKYYEAKELLGEYKLKESEMDLPEISSKDIMKALAINASGIKLPSGKILEITEVEPLSGSVPSKTPARDYIKGMMPDESNPFLTKQGVLDSRNTLDVMVGNIVENTFRVQSEQEKFLKNVDFMGVKVLDPPLVPDFFKPASQLSRLAGAGEFVSSTLGEAGRFYSTTLIAKPEKAPLVNMIPLSNTLFGGEARFNRVYDTPFISKQQVSGIADFGETTGRLSKNLAYLTPLQPVVASMDIASARSVEEVVVPALTVFGTTLALKGLYKGLQYAPLKASEFLGGSIVPGSKMLQFSSSVPQLIHYGGVATKSAVPVALAGYGLYQTTMSLPYLYSSDKGVRLEAGRKLGVSMGSGSVGGFAGGWLGTEIIDKPFNWRISEQTILQGGSSVGTLNPEQKLFVKDLFKRAYKKELPGDISVVTPIKDYTSSSLKIFDEFSPTTKTKLIKIVDSTIKEFGGDLYIGGSSQVSTQTTGKPYKKTGDIDVFLGTKEFAEVLTKRINEAGLKGVGAKLNVKGDKVSVGLIKDGVDLFKAKDLEFINVHTDPSMSMTKGQLNIFGEPFTSTRGSFVETPSGTKVFNIREQLRGKIQGYFFGGESRAKDIVDIEGIMKGTQRTADLYKEYKKTNIFLDERAIFKPASEVGSSIVEVPKFSSTYNVRSPVSDYVVPSVVSFSSLGAVVDYSSLDKPSKSEVVLKDYVLPKTNKQDYVLPTVTDYNKVLGKQVYPSFVPKQTKTLIYRTPERKNELIPYPVITPSKTPNVNIPVYTIPRTPYKKVFETRYKFDDVSKPPVYPRNIGGYPPITPPRTPPSGKVDLFGNDFSRKRKVKEIRKISLGRRKSEPVFQLKSDLFRKFASGEKDLLVSKESVKLRNILWGRQGSFSAFIPTKNLLEKNYLKRTGFGSGKAWL